MLEIQTLRSKNFGLKNVRGLEAVKGLSPPKR